MDRKPSVPMRAQLVESLQVNRPVITMSLIMTAACGLLLAAEQYGVPAVKMLELSPSNPWGIFTLMFVHNGWDHMFGNVVMLWLWTALVFLLDSMHSASDRRKRVRFFIIAVVGSAVIAHSVWFVLAVTLNQGQPFSSVGASGLAYAFGGAVLGFSIMNATDAS